MIGALRFYGKSIVFAALESIGADAEFRGAVILNHIVRINHIVGEYLLAALVLYSDFIIVDYESFGRLSLGEGYYPFAAVILISCGGDILREYGSGIIRFHILISVSVGGFIVYILNIIIAEVCVGKQIIAAQTDAAVIIRLYDAYFGGRIIAVRMLAGNAVVIKLKCSHCTAADCRISALPD